MKKLLCLLILMATLLFTACADEKYPPVESTEEESRVLMTMTVGDAEYDVKYELYRALFLTYKSDIDGGDESVWTSEKADEYIEKINAFIIPKIADIYSTIYICEQTGFDFDSSEVDDAIETYIDESVNGGAHDSTVIEGYGTYENFLNELKKLNINYSVQILLYKYAIAQDAIDEYYIGSLNEDNLTPDATEGALEYTDEDIRAFYESDECVRVLQAFIQEKLGADRAEEVREDMKNADGENAVGLQIINNTVSSPSEALNGIIIGKHSLDVSFYEELTNAAFSLDIGETSDVILVRTGYDNGYFILYRAEKNEAHFEKCYTEILGVYLENEIGKMLADAKAELLKDIDYKDAYSSLVHGNISMD